MILASSSLGERQEREGGRGRAAAPAGTVGGDRRQTPRPPPLPAPAGPLSVVSLLPHLAALLGFRAPGVWWWWVWVWVWVVATVVAVTRGGRGAAGGGGVRGRGAPSAPTPPGCRTCCWSDGAACLPSIRCRALYRSRLPRTPAVRRGLAGGGEDIPGAERGLGRSQVCRGAAAGSPALPGATPPRVPSRPLPHLAERWEKLDARLQGGCPWVCMPARAAACEGPRFLLPPPPHQESAALGFCAPLPTPRSLRRVGARMCTAPSLHSRHSCQRQLLPATLPPGSLWGREGEGCV